EEAKIGDIDLPIAVDVAEEAVEAAKDIIISGNAVAIPIEPLAGNGDLARQGCERVASVGKRAKLRGIPPEVVQSDHGDAADDCRRRAELLDRAVGAADKGERCTRRDRKCDWRIEGDGQ